MILRKHKGDTLIIVLMLAMMGVGLLVMYTIGPVRANFLNSAMGKQVYSDNYFFLHQLISVVLSLVVFFAFAKFKMLNYKNVQKGAKILLYVSFSMCVLLAISQVVHLPLAKCELGACRWIQLGPISIQPAEFVKFSTIIYLAILFEKYRGDKDILKNKDFLLRFAGVFGAALFFIVFVQKDLGSGLPVAMIALSMLFQSGLSFKRFFIAVSAVVLLGVGAMLTSPHRRERLATFFGGNSSSQTESNEENDASAYHIENALIAIGTGGLFGVGIGNSVQATGYLPESINDSVFAIMGETFGFVGLVVVLSGFVWLLMRVLRVADYSANFANSMIAVGAFAWIMTHLVVNVMAMTGITPLTGITLPLLSYGGTSMMAVAGILGLVYQLSEYTSREIVTDQTRRDEEANMKDKYPEMVRYEQSNYRRRR
jgi:cell division protein FtsW